ncbi:MAG: uL15 family ribosomal protein [Nanoarchaeota archaeon]|nr:uL15 family ribosomal protein [Nanoarchaeota archaeon]
MIRHRKKSRKIRGRKTGRGSGKRARGAGNRGGRGKAGINKRAGHRKTMLIKYPELSSREKGFKSVKQKHNFHPKAINVGDLDKLANKLGNEIDLTKLGYGKLLGSGKVKNKITVKVNSFTETAKNKIESAGGKIISG